MSYEGMPRYAPWHPMKDAKDLKTLGKLGEELGECSAAVSRCIIQGIDEKAPITDKINRHWLEDEIADVLVNIYIVVAHFQLNDEEIKRRAAFKRPLIQGWHDEA